MVDEKPAADYPSVDARESETRWRFWSTRDSIEHDVPSVFAGIETLLAVPVFWWLAGTFGFYLPLMISVAVAPFVLLRSDDSVDLGLRWFLTWHKRKGRFSVVNPRERDDIPPLDFAARLIIQLGSGAASILYRAWTNYFW